MARQVHLVQYSNTVSDEKLMLRENHQNTGTIYSSSSDHLWLMNFLNWIYYFRNSWVTKLDFFDESLPKAKTGKARW